MRSPTRSSPPAPTRLVVHARKAWLTGLCPKENRDVPPLDYALVHRLKRAFPQTSMAINGGIATIDAMKAQLREVDGVMIGRAAYQNPELLLAVDPQLFGEEAPFADALEAIEAYYPYVERQLAQGERLSAMTRHMLGFFAGRPGARRYRRRLTVEAVQKGADLALLRAVVEELRGSEEESGARSGESCVVGEIRRCVRGERAEG